jgi:hypothetical protein
MARKVATLTIRVVIETNDDSINIDDVISDLDYEITSNTDGATVVDSEIRDRETD